MAADDLLVIDNNSPQATHYHPHSEDIGTGPDNNPIKRSIVVIDAPAAVTNGIASAAATPTGLLAKNGPGRFVGVQATSNSIDTAGFVVVCDLPALPAQNAAIRPKKWAPLPIAPSATYPATADLDQDFAFANGCVVLLTTSLTAYTPGDMTGLLSASIY